MTRVFISYGHDEYAFLAERIKSDLEASGHEAWFDIDRLRPGGDWETYIAEGLEWVAESSRSGWFLLLMTPHSVRRPARYEAPGGYCLNEIARAIARELPILPIMVAQCEPPLSICRLQWLDMRDCAAFPDQEEQYKKKLGQCLAVLEGAPFDFQGVQSRLLRQLQPFHFNSEMTRHLPRFVGREWLFRDVEAWLANPNGPRIFWLTGDPGVGKTAIAAWLCSHHRAIAASHFCRQGDDLRADPRRCVMSIAYQLATQLPDYRDRLNALDLARLVSNANAGTLFNALVVEPLAKGFPAPDGTIVLLIDALDEATTGEENQLAEFIAASFADTPSWLRLIITSRPESTVTLPLQGLDPYILHRTSDNNKQDIQTYVAREFARFAPHGTIPQDTTERIDACSEGLFLYLRCLHDELAQGRLSLARPEEFPQGLGEVYWRFFKRQFPDARSYQESVRPVVEVVCACREAPPVELLASIFDWTDYQCIGTTETLGSLFPMRERRVEVFHRSVIDWLEDGTKSGLYFVSSAGGHHRLADFGWAAYLSGRYRHLPYVLAHLPAHLRTAERWKELVSIVQDLSFAVARCAEGLGRHVVSDYDAALVSPGLPHDPTLKTFMHTCRYSLPFLDGPRDAVISRLELSAWLLALEGVAQRLNEVHESRPYRTHWARIQAAMPHQIVARGDWTALTMGEVDGMPVVVTAAATSERNLRLWNARTGIPCGPAMTAHFVRFNEDSAGSINCIAFGTLGEQHLVVSGGDDQRVNVWDARRCEVLHQSSDLAHPVSSLAFSEVDGKPVVIALAGGTVHLLDASTLHPVLPPFAIEGRISDGTFTTFQGTPILTGIMDRRDICVWSVAHRREICAPIGSARGLSHLAACEYKGDLLIAVVAGRHEVHTYSANDPSKHWPVIDTGGETVTSLCLGAWDGAPIVVAGTFAKEVHLWRLDTGKPLVEPLRGHRHSATTLMVTQIDGVPSLLSGSLDGTVRRWGFADTQRVGGRLPLEGVSTVATGHVGNTRMAVFGRIGEVVVCDLDTGETILPILKGLVGMAPQHVAVTAIGDDWAIVGGYWNGGRVLGWDASTGRCLGMLCDFPFNMNAMLCANVDGHTLLIGAGSNAGEGLIGIYDVMERKFVSAPMSHRSVDTLCLDRAAAGRVNLYSVGGGWIRRWDVPSGEHITETEALPLIFPKSTLICEVNGKPLLVCGSNDGLHVFDLPSGERHLEAPVHIQSSSTIWALQYCNIDGETAVVSAGLDGTVRFWNPHNWQNVRVIDVDFTIRDIAVDADTLLIAGNRGIVALKLNAGVLRSDLR